MRLCLVIFILALFGCTFEPIKTHEEFHRVDSVRQLIFDNRPISGIVGNRYRVYLSNGDSITTRRQWSVGDTIIYKHYKNTK